MENKIIYYNTLDSTNVKARELGLEGAASGTVVVAKEQTAGRGRRGRSWESPAGENIYMSVLLRPEIEAQKAPMLTLVMAYSVAQVLREEGYHEAQIKWPNDIVIAGKKVCGILTEMEMNGFAIGHVVIGVGINGNREIFPEELSGKATSLFLEKGEKADCEELIKKVVEQFEKDYKRFLEAGNLSFLKEAYDQMLVNCDKEVRVLEPGNEYNAVALGITSEGELMVRKEDGSIENVFAGEVSVRGVLGYV